MLGDGNGSVLIEPGRKLVFIGLDHAHPTACVPKERQPYTIS